MVIDGNKSEFDRAIESGATKEQVILARSLGVQQMCLAINKMDLVEWSKERYEFIVS
jgi:elongation factor 1 alpha-like protein